MDKVIDGIYPQTNYTTQQFYTKEEYDKLQAENFELKGSLKVYERPDIKKVLTYYRTGELERLEQENERLKEENEHLTEKEEESKHYLQEAYKFHQALQEIREIAKEQLQDVSDRCINTTPMYIVHKHILAKINEVIGAE